MTRTDLALESVTMDSLPEYVHIEHRGKAFSITEIIIDNDDALETIGKGKGRYITLECDSLSRFSAEYSEMAEELAAELRKLIPDGDILVAGLGNADITPDALGPQTVSLILATRHLRSELDNFEEEFLCSLRPVSAFAGGVLGQTAVGNGLPYLVKPQFGFKSRVRHSAVPPKRRLRSLMLSIFVILPPWTNEICPVCSLTTSTWASHCSEMPMAALCLIP